MDLNRKETTGTIQILGMPVLTGLYAQTAEQRAAWKMRVPAWLRWACTIRWHMTFTAAHEERDAIGRIIETGPLKPSEADQLLALLHRLPNEYGHLLTTEALSGMYVEDGKPPNV